MPSEFGDPEEIRLQAGHVHGNSTTENSPLQNSFFDKGSTSQPGLVWRWGHALHQSFLEAREAPHG
jgi:hypothetical protein